MTILAKIRNLISDYAVSGSDIFTYGSSRNFSLSEANIVSVTDVSVNDVSSGIAHSYNSTTNKVNVSSSLTSGDTIQVDYTFYNNYSDNELYGFMKAAITYLSAYNYYSFEVDTSNNVYPSPTSREEDLIALVASLLINQPMTSLRLPDISINFNEKMSLDEKIAKAISVFKASSSGIFDVLN